MTTLITGESSVGQELVYFAIEATLNRIGWVTMWGKTYFFKNCVLKLSVPALEAGCPKIWTKGTSLIMEEFIHTSGEHALCSRFLSMLHHFNLT